MKTIFSKLLIHLVSFQLLFADVYTQTAFLTQKRNIASIEDQNELIEKMSAFKLALVGEDISADCNTGQPAQKQPQKSNQSLSWQEYLTSLGKTKSADDEGAPDEKNCLNSRKKGYLDTVIAKIIKAEDKNNGAYKMHSLDSRELIKMSFYQRRAADYLNEVQSLLENTSLTIKTRRAILIQYLKHVALPIRDYYIAIQVYLDAETNTTKIYEDLLPSIPSELSKGEGAKTFHSALVVDSLSLKIKESFIGDDELVFDTIQILQRDVITILKAPTAANYVRALKWMSLSMMLQQAQMYDVMNGKPLEFEVPKSCQVKRNGMLPALVQSSMTPKQGETILNNILLNQRLAFPEKYEKAEGQENEKNKKISQAYIEYRDYYLDNVDRDPLYDGYSGLMPFEQYKAAKQATSESEDRFIRPDFDDYTHFQQVVDMKMPQALSVFHDKRSYLFGWFDFEDKYYHGAHLVESFFKPSPEDESVTIYMAELMKRHQVTDWDDLISDSLTKYLEKNRIVVNFPSFYGSQFRRQAAFNNITMWLEDNVDKNLSVAENKVFSNMCNYSKSKSTGVCSPGDSSKIAKKKLLKYLYSIKNADDFVPTREVNNERHINSYKLLRYVWVSLSLLHPVTNNFAVSETNEKDYLIDQFKVGNPWAQARLSYLLALDELGAIEEGVLPEFSNLNKEEHGQYVRSLKRRHKHKRRHKRYRVSAAIKLRNNTRAVIAKLTKAARIIGVHSVLHPGHANYTLSKNDKKHLWKEMAKEGSELFSFKDGNGDYLYQKLDTVASKTLLVKSDLNEFLRNSFSQDILDGEAKSALDEIMESELAQKGQFMLDIYKLKAEPDKQLELFREFASRFGLDNSFSVKLNFLHLDNAIKVVLYKSLLRKAAREIRAKIDEAMDELCSVEVNDFDTMRHMYFATVKQHNAINQLNGKAALSSKTLGKLEKVLKDVSREESRDAWLGGGLFVVIMGTAFMATSCVLSCPALLLAAPFIVASTGVVAYGEVSRYRGANKFIDNIGTLEDLNYLDEDSIAEIRRHWAWAAIEVGSAVSLIGITARSLMIGGKILGTLPYAIGRESGVGFKDLTKNVVKEVKLNHERIVLEADKRISQFKDTKANIFNLRPHVVEESVEELHGKTASVFLSYLGGSAKALEHVISSYRKMLAKAALKVEAANKIKTRHFPIVGWKIPSARKFIASMRYERLHQNADMIIALEKRVNKLVQNKGDPKKFILDNIEDLTDLLMDVPMRLRELPYMLLGQGGAHVGRGIVSVGGPTYRMANGLVIKKIFNASSSLVFESLLGKARRSLGVTAKIAEDSTFDIFQEFQQSMMIFLKNSDDKNVKSYVRGYKKMEDDLVDQIAKHSPEKDKKLIRRTVLRPSNQDERSKGQAIWESVDPEKIFGLDAFQENAHRLASRLYTTVNGFEERLSSLKVLMLVKRKAGEVDIL
jgi:hypothetical protein